MTKRSARDLEADALCTKIVEAIDQELWDCSFAIGLSGFDSEDPTLMGRPEDGCDGLGVTVVRKSDGARFQIDVQVSVDPRPVAILDSAYLIAHRRQPDQ